MNAEEPLAEMHFSGARYQHHALDRAALNEAGRFLAIAEDIATLLWRRAFPATPTPPATFVDQTRLYAQSVKPGSAVIPFHTISMEGVQRELPLAVESAQWPTMPQVLQHLIRAFEGDGRNTLYLESLPAELLGKLGALGDQLAEGSSCILAVPGRGKALIDSTVRARIRSVANTLYEDAVDIAGTVTRVNLKTRECGIETRDGKILALRFPSRLEDKITQALRDHQSTEIRVLGRGEYSASGSLKSLTSWESVSLDTAAAHGGAEVSAEAVIDRLFSDLNAENWGKLPQNLAEDHDAYSSGGSSDD